MSVFTGSVQTLQGGLLYVLNRLKPLEIKGFWAKKDSRYFYQYLLSITLHRWHQRDGGDHVRIRVRKNDSLDRESYVQHTCHRDEGCS